MSTAGDSVVTATRRGPVARDRDAALFERILPSLSARFSRVRWDRVDAESAQALNEIVGLCGIDRVGICEVLPDKSEAHLRHVACAAHVVPLPKRFNYAALFPWMYAKRMLRGQVMALSNLDALPAKAHTDKVSLQLLGMRSVLDIPVDIDGEVRFILTAACHGAAHEWTKRSIASLRAIAAMFSGALARAQAVGAMLASQHDLHDAENAVHLGRWEWDIGADRLLMSEEATRIFGCELARLGDLMALVAPCDHDKLARAISHARGEPGERVGVRYTIRTPGGEERMIQQWHEVLFAGERTARLFAAIQDETASIKTQQEVIELRSHHWHSSRVAQTGLLVASLAHELSQPLAAILSNAQAGLRFLGNSDLDPEEIRNILADIVASDKRASEVVGALRAMLRRQHTARVTFEAEEVVQDVLALVRSELMSEQIEVEASLETGCYLNADKTQIEQVLLNLVMNAIDAMRGRPHDQRRLIISLSCNDGNLRFSVKDTGSGIPANNLRKVFEAFWTTKKKGLGMGLSVCRSIIESYGGRIGLEANGDTGATFHFTIPACEDPELTPTESKRESEAGAH